MNDDDWDLNVDEELKDDKYDKKEVEEEEEDIDKIVKCLVITSSRRFELVQTLNVNYDT